MQIDMLRMTSTDDATLGVIVLEDEFQCFTLEDEFREEKVARETRIPEGNYSVRVKISGRLHERYKRRFPDFHLGMLELLDVPNFTDILIHIGNTDEDTSGCILVGAGCTTAGELAVYSSTTAYTSLYKRVVEAALNENLYINIIDGER